MDADGPRYFICSTCGNVIAFAGISRSIAWREAWCGHSGYGQHVQPYLPYEGAADDGWAKMAGPLDAGDLAQILRADADA